MAKHSKNLQKVQDMLDGKGGGKIQVGYSTAEEKHEVGDIWTDSDNTMWEQKNGYRSNITKLANRGIVDYRCSGCEKFIVKPWDKDTHKADGRCYHCQMNYELDLSFDAPIRWFAYRRLKDFKNQKSIENEMEQWVEEFTKMRNEKVFDEKVANALANSEVELTINKNKAMS